MPVMLERPLNWPSRWVRRCDVESFIALLVAGSFEGSGNYAEDFRLQVGLGGPFCHFRGNVIKVRGSPQMTAPRQSQRSNLSIFSLSTGSNKRREPRQYQSYPSEPYAFIKRLNTRTVDFRCCRGNLRNHGFYRRQKAYLFFAEDGL